MKKIIKHTILIIILLIVGIGNVEAATNYTVSLSSNNVKKGKTVTLYIKGNNVTGGFTITSSDSTVASVSTSSAWVENNTISVSINTNKVGTSTITITPTTLSDDNGNDLNLGAKKLDLTVSDGSTTEASTNVKKSSDATLKSLSIENEEISPSFKSDILEYSAEIDSKYEKIKINAVPNDSKASVTGTGEIDMSDGINKLEVVVTAEDGTIKTYKLNVTVEEKNPINVTINTKKYTVVKKEKDLPEVDLFEKRKVKINDEEVPGYYNEKLDFYLIGLKDEEGQIKMYIYNAQNNTYKEYKWITISGITLYINEYEGSLENFKKYKTTIKNINLEIYKLNEKESQGLIYGTSVGSGYQGFFIYDKEEETLSRYYDEEVKIYKNRINNYKNYIMIGVGIVSAIIIIVVVISLLKGRNKRRKNKRKIK